MSRRIYILNGKEIDASECAGFLHKATKEKGECICCGKPIKTRQEYVIPNYYDCNDTLYHLKCFLHHGENDIIGVSIKRQKNIYGIIKTHIFCRVFPSTLLSQQKGRKAAGGVG